VGPRLLVQAWSSGPSVASSTRTMRSVTRQLPVAVRSCLRAFSSSPCSLAAQPATSAGSAGSAGSPPAAGPLGDGIAAQLEEMRRAGTYKVERVIESPQSSTIGGALGGWSLHLNSTAPNSLSSRPELGTLSNQGHQQLHTTGSSIKRDRFTCRGVDTWSDVAVLIGHAPLTHQQQLPSR
jgi:hypothetical protein